MIVVRKFVVRWEIGNEIRSAETDDEDEAIGVFNVMKALAHHHSQIKSVSFWENVRLG